jgi:hypothetical protein
MRNTNNPHTNKISNMALTDTFVKNAKHSGKPTGDKHSNGGGLHLHITPSGKYWRLAYRFNDKQKTLSLGRTPTYHYCRPESAVTMPASC